MKKNKKKIIVAFMIFIIAILFISQVVQATTVFNPEHYKPSSTNSVSGASKLEHFGNKIIGVVQIIGSVSSVIALILIGIKYIMGSVEEKAQYKETLKPYVIGAILLFGITNILTIVANVVGGF